MYIIFLYLISAVITLTQNITAKFTSNALVGRPTSAYAMFTLTSGIISCLFYWIMNGFKINATPTVILFSLGFTLALCLSNIGILTVYRFLNVANVLVILSSSQLIMISLAGALFFKEEITVLKVIKILIMLMCIFLSFIDTKKREAPDKTGTKINVSASKVVITVILLLITMTANSSITVLNKFYTISNNVTDEESYLFFGNLFMVFISAAILLCAYFRSPSVGKLTFSMVKTRSFIFMIINALGGGISCLIALLIIANLDVTIATPISSAVGMIMTVMTSLILKEKIGIYSYIAVALSILVFVI